MVTDKILSWKIAVAALECTQVINRVLGELGEEYGGQFGSYVVGMLAVNYGIQVPEVFKTQEKTSD